MGGVCGVVMYNRHVGPDEKIDEQNMILHKNRRHVHLFKEVCGKPDQAFCACIRWWPRLSWGVRTGVTYDRHVSSDENRDEHNMALHWKVEEDVIRPCVHALGVGGAPDGRSAGSGDVQQACELRREV